MNTLKKNKLYHAGTCPVTGMSLFGRPEWTNVGFGSDYSITLRVLGDNIILFQPSGSVTIHEIKEAVELIKQAEAEIKTDDRKIISIEDYSDINRVSIEARKYYIDYLKRERDIEGLVFTGLSPMLKLSIKLAKRLNIVKFDVKIVNGYSEAVKLALDMLSIDNPLPENILNNTVLQSSAALPDITQPYNIACNDEWNLRFEDYSLRFELINDEILHSISNGFLKEEYIEDIGRMREKVNNSLGANRNFKYIIANVKPLTGVSRQVRKRYMASLIKWHELHPIEMYVFYGFNRFIRAAAALARPSIPFKVKLAKDIDSALKLISQEKTEKLEIFSLSPDTALQDKIVNNIGQRYIDDLLCFLGNIEWEAEGFDHSPAADPSHPFSKVFDALSIIKVELGGLLQERARARDELKRGVEERTTELRRMNDQLVQEIGERKRTEKELVEYRGRLEEMVQNRTAELSKANEHLKREIAGRKQAESVIEKLESAVEQSIDGIAIKAFDTKFIYVNNAFAEMHGYSTEEMIGMKAEQVYNKTWMHEINRIINQLKKQGSWMGEIEHKKKNGSVFPVYISTTLLKDADHESSETLEIVRDITSQKVLEAQFRQAQKMEALGTLSGGIAHNFNNLLMGILGNASIMLLDIDDIHPYYQRLKTIERLVENGSKLTSQLLGYTRKGDYEVAPIDLNQLVKEVSDTFENTKKEVRVYKELAVDLKGIKADKGQIEQVLFNLFINAADAMPLGGELSLNSMNVTHEDIGGSSYNPKPGRYVLLSVKDTGAGMDNETMSRIFEPFFTTKGLAKGTGLGLASAYGIIKAHGGYIDVQSKKGHGTVFSIYLPASENTISNREQTSGQIKKGKGNILLVDDEEIILATGINILEHLGYTVFHAGGGEEAVEIFKRDWNKISLVILDMVMSDLGGGEVYDRIKEIDQNVKVLLASGYSIEGQAKEILAKGCNGFIQKPFKIDELSRKIRETMET